ncbi:G protein-activated inward rectifier potassium channel 4-like isoform X2 [Artemia franciscana]|uniref:G protein-activated inward rectifier potassium channel 4-like isoform X2 n=2 Tax=Artemia franciscana TaxID=6661 RepID=UPI0032DA16F9
MMINEDINYCLINAVREGNLERTRELLSFNNPLGSTNLVILACEHNKILTVKHSWSMDVRLVSKNGECNISNANLTQNSRLLSDLFTTLVDARWRWIVLIIVITFWSSWLFFAIFWYIICYAHGDFEIDNLPHGPRQKSGEFIPCVGEMYSFTSAVLLSIEAQQTSGFGGKRPTEHCLDGIYLFFIQIIFGLILEAFLVGVVIAKLARPKMRSQTVLFSKKAAICMRDGNLCIMFRVADIRRSMIVDAKVRGELVRTRTTIEGEQITYCQQDLELKAENGRDSFFFFLPIRICHVINQSSPFYKMSADDLMNEEFEIIVVIEGEAEATGLPVQAKSSYIAKEVIWGYRFKNMVSLNKNNKTHSVNYKLFDEMDEVDTPLCSAKDLDEVRRLKEEYGVEIDFRENLVQ